MRKRFFLNCLLILTLVVVMSTSAFAISESDVESAVSASGKEAVSGNVLVWFLCAIAFLKVSQKIDSFLSSLGLNVGHTGGSMLSEAMIAMRAINTCLLYTSDLSDKQCKALLKSPRPLADVFRDFEKRETDHMDNIRDTIECRANAVIRADFLRDRREAR